jgi:hypothetical protein
MQGEAENRNRGQDRKQDSNLQRKSALSPSKEKENQHIQGARRIADMYKRKKVVTA